MLLAEPVGVAIAGYNNEIVERLSQDFMDHLCRSLTTNNKPLILRVPGSLELAHALRVLARQQPQPVVLVALGCVIRGQTYHFEVVSNTSAHALERVSETTGLPVVNGILTCEDQIQAQSRSKIKGHEFAATALHMANLSMANI